MPRATRSLTRRLTCVMTDSEIQGLDLVLRYSPLRGHPPEIVDRICFRPDVDEAVVRGVGRFLRLLRAARLRPPKDPYHLYREPQRVGELALRCRGTEVELELRKRFERALSVWTEAGVERFAPVVDFHEEGDALVVRRRGRQTALRVPRHTLIRYEASTLESYEVVGVG